MKCPLLSIACATSHLPLEKITDNCLKRDCEWWDDVTEQCCIKTLARGIVPIINDLRELVKKKGG